MPGGSARTKHRRHGFVMQQLLLTLVIVMTLLPLEVAAMRILVKHVFFEETMQDEIGLAQLRRVMNVCYDKVIQDDRLTCFYQGEPVELRNNGNHLFLSAGTWIFLAHVEEVRFAWKNTYLTMAYRRKEHWEEVVIGIE